MTDDEGMSNPPPTALPYESPDSNSREDIFWRAFRFAVIAWSAAVLSRHASYWLALIMQQSSIWVSDGRALLFALMECVVLGGVLINALSVKRQNHRQHLSLAGWCVAFIVLSLVGFVFDWFASRYSMELDARSVLRSIWLLVSRLQLLVVPAMVIFVVKQWRGRPREMD